MRKRVLTAAVVLAMGLAACQTTGYGGGYGGTGASTGAPTTRLSSCMRNALIGAGIGAVAGAIQGSENNRAENAAIGAAIGGGGTFAVCKLLDNQQQARIEAAYQTALAQNRALSTGWVGASSRTYQLDVQRPQPVAGQQGCRVINASLNVNGQGPQALPTERYCVNGAGGWSPAA